MSTAFRSWRALESGRQAKARAALQRIADHKGLSRDVADIVQRALADELEQRALTVVPNRRRRLGLGLRRRRVPLQKVGRNR